MLDLFSCFFCFCCFCYSFGSLCFLSLIICLRDHMRLIGGGLFSFAALTN